MKHWITILAAWLLMATTEVAARFGCGDVITVNMNESVLVPCENADMAIANPAIANILLQPEKNLAIVIGFKAGTTTLTIIPKDDRPAFLRLVRVIDAEAAAKADGATAPIDRGDLLMVNMNESVVVPCNYADVAIANPTIANVFFIPEKNIVSVIGVKAGTTTLTIIPKDDRPAFQRLVRVIDGESAAKADGAAAPSDRGDLLMVNMNESVLAPCKNADVAISNPGIANIVLWPDKNLVSVVGVKAGATTLTIIPKDDSPVSQRLVRVIDGEAAAKADGTAAPSDRGDLITVNMNESELVPCENAHAAMANPAIANVVLFPEKNLVSVIGLKAGTTMLTIVPKDDRPAFQRLVRVIDVEAESAPKADAKATNQE